MWIFSFPLFSHLFLSLSSFFFFHFCLVILTFETEILVAQADFETDYIVGSDLDLLILLLHLSSAGTVDECYHVHRQLHVLKKFYESYWSHCRDGKLRGLVAKSKVQQSTPSTRPGHLNSVLSHPSFCPNCLRAKNAFHSQE